MAIDNTPRYVDAIYHLYTFNMDMGDSMQELAEFVCHNAGLDYDSLSSPDIDSNAEPMEDDEILNLFFELDLPDDWSKSTRVKRRNEMLSSLFAVYEILDDFPDGAKAKKALEDNILSRL